MKRDYIRVKPSRESINPDDIVSHLSSLHKLVQHNRHTSVKSRLNPLEDSSEKVPTFEFLAISQGKDAPVQFFYGTDKEHLDTLKNRLTTAYPASFDIDIVDVDLLQKVVPPERYTPDDFAKKYRDGHIMFDPDSKGTPDDIEGDHRGKTTGAPSSESSENTSKQSGSTSSGGKQDSGSLSLNVSRPSETTKPRIAEDTVTSEGEKKQLMPDELDGYEMLEEIDAGLLDLIDLPDDLDVKSLSHQIDGPTWTEDGDIMARPSLEHGDPVAVRWEGDAERKKDWMTTLKMFSKVAEPGADNIQDRAPLAILIQHLAETELPIVYQVVFKRIEDWERAAERRKDNLHLDRDTLGQKIMYELGELIHKPSKERRRERLRDYMDKMGESADYNEDSPVAGQVGDRRKLIDNKIPKRTFRVNIRAVTVATYDSSIDQVENEMDNLASVLDHLDGYFYGLKPDILRDGQGYRNKKKATEELHRLLNREIVSGSGKTRPDIVVNADELGNFLAVPSSKNLTVEGVRGTRAEAEARDPLAKPDPDLMRHFHQPGMRIGYALDKEAEREPVPTQVPPKLLTKHYGRFATTGAGKSKALINDILSLYENTSGPTILIDPKGDGMTENYMQAHFERFGEEEFKENIIHYPIPDILPGFTFFNIKPSLRQGQRRADAIQNKADHYQELLKLVMGRERYEESKVAPTIISALIKALFDEHYVESKQREKERGESMPDDILAQRDDPNMFTHRHLEKLTQEVRYYGTNDDNRPGEIPDVSNDAIRFTLEEQAEGDSRTFATIMNAVFNRLNYIREDTHLRRIFNNTEEQFDFRDHLHDNKVILFDLGDLRDDATIIMTGLILTNLWDALQESDRTECTQDHGSLVECREKARKNGLDPTEPPCREPWPDDHLVNLIIDEAASVAVSDIINKMLEQGRSFNLSVGLSMQFPEQMKTGGGDRMYRNVLNNIATLLIGKITLDEEIAMAMAHEGMEVEDFRNRIKALPRGEWIAQLPSPEFMETGPDPFSLQPLPIPAGHPESQHVLTEEAKQRYKHYLENQVHRKTQEDYGIEITDDEGKSPNQKQKSVSTSSLQGGGDSEKDSVGGDHSVNNGSNHTEVNDDAFDDTTLGDVNVIDDTEHEEHQGEQDDEDTVSQEVEESKGSESELGEMGVSANGGTSISDPSGGGIWATELDPDSLPSHIEWNDDTNFYECLNCGELYYQRDRNEAKECCKFDLLDLKESMRTREESLDLPEREDYRKSQPVQHEYLGLETSCSSVAFEQEVEFIDQTPPVLDEDMVIDRESDLVDVLVDPSSSSYGAVVSTIVAVTPPEYQEELEYIIDWYVSQLDTHVEGVENDYLLSFEYLTELAFETPPVDLKVDIESLLSRVSDSPIDTSVIRSWEFKNCDPEFKRFYSGRVGLSDASFDRTGRIGLSYSDVPGMSEPIEPGVFEPVVFDFPDSDDSSASVEKKSAGRLSPDHLSKYEIDQEDAAFMRAVVEAMNGDLDGYDLTKSMAGTIRSQYDVDVDYLVQKGYLREHKLGKRVYYTVTPEGQDACDRRKKSGRNIGDQHDETPHRVGGLLTKLYYEQLPDVRYVDTFVPVNGGILDVKVVGDKGVIVAAGEIESGKVSADGDLGEGETPGTNNYESIRDDAELIAETEGESIWIVRNHEVAGTVLRALNAGDLIDVDNDVIQRVENRTMKIQTLNESVIADIDYNGFDKMITYTQLRRGIVKDGE